MEIQLRAQNNSKVKYDCGKNGLFTDMAHYHDGDVLIFILKTSICYLKLFARANIL